MAGTIRMTPDELRGGASDLISKKGEALSILQAMKTKIEEVEAGWEGAAQNKFVQMFEETYTSVTKMLEESVTGISKALEGAAQTLEEVDQSLFS